MPVASCSHQFKNWWQPYALPVGKAAIESRSPPGGIYPKGWCFSFLPEQGTRTHLNARCQWHLAATSSKTGGNHTLCPLAKRPSSPVVHPPEASTPKGGVFISDGARSRTKMTGRWYPACHFLYQNRSDNRKSATCHGAATSCRNQLCHSGKQRFSINCWFCTLLPRVLFEEFNTFCYSLLGSLLSERAMADRIFATLPSCKYTGFSRCLL